MSTCVDIGLVRADAIIPKELLPVLCSLPVCYSSRQCTFSLNTLVFMHILLDVGFHLL